MMNLPDQIKARVIEAYFTDAISLTEIAFHFGIPSTAVVEILQAEQNSQHRTAFSTKFKKRVAEFAHRNSDSTMSNIARYFYLKDDRRIREWVIEFPSTPKRDPQHSLLDVGTNVWKTKYENLLKKYTSIKTALAEIQAVMRGVTSE